mmetsp:Transcript_52199/g.77878  ORF Transcript_52199/g.77878 Transcript_52199/m.77878 type:complete len:443 (-) Transcript_52199:210-1538(-)
MVKSAQKHRTHQKQNETMRHNKNRRKQPNSRSGQMIGEYYRSMRLHSLSQICLVSLCIVWTLCECNALAPTPLTHYYLHTPTQPFRPSSYRSTAVFASQQIYNDEYFASADPTDSIKAFDDLVPRRKINALSKCKSNVQGGLQLSFHLALFALAAFIPTQSLSLLGKAFVSSFFFNGLHEAVHRTAFKSKIVNDICAHIFGFLCMRPARHYFYYHWQHHKYTGNVKLDSELQEGSFLDLPIDEPIGYVAYITGIPFWIDAVSTLCKHGWGSCPEIYLLTDKARQEISREARVYLMLYTLIAVLATTWRKILIAPLLSLWVLPALLGQPFLRFYLLAEHRGRSINTPIIYENTRTMSTNWLYDKLAWHMPYHMEHHAWPSVPFHKLRDAHELLVNSSGDAGGVAILDRGEIYPEFHGGVGKSGYISFNYRFLRRLFQKKREKK